MRTLKWSPDKTLASIGVTPPGDISREIEDNLPNSEEIEPLFAGKYRIDRVLGRGGVGIVYGAMHVAIDRRVAIKVLRPEALRHKDVLKRFEREARASASIVSDHVARIYDVGVLEDQRPYIVMEHLEGHDFADVLDDSGGLAMTDAIDYTVQICEALAAAHAVGIVHRDLKPANIFLAQRRDGSTIVKVLDFGLSKITNLDPRDRAITDTMLVMGTPGWMSPEQMRSTRDVDARSDIWAVGAILYYMLTGAPPFIVKSLAHLYATVISTKPEPPSRVNPALPMRLDVVVLRCLEQDREDRWRTVADLVDALAPFASPQTLERIATIKRVLRRSAESQTNPYALSRSAQVMRGVSSAGILLVPSQEFDRGGIAPLAPSLETASPRVSPPARRTRALWALVPAAATIGALLAFFAPSRTPATPAAQLPAAENAAAAAPPVVTSSANVEVTAATASSPAAAAPTASAKTEPRPPPISRPPVPRGGSAPRPAREHPEFGDRR